MFFFVGQNSCIYKGSLPERGYGIYTFATAVSRGEKLD